MKKTFTLREEGKNADRLMDAIRHELRKYVRRERGKRLPEGSDYWAFDCRVGLTADDAEPSHVDDLGKRLTALFETGASAAYVEILARAATRTRRPA